MSFDEWAVRHATVFGLTNEEDVKTLLSWQDALAASPAELQEATAWLAKNSQAIDIKRGKMLGHLEALRSRIVHRRTETARVEGEIPEHDFGTCTLCSSSGFAVVPHLRCVRDGYWHPPWYTVAVLCSCALGRWKGDRYTAERRPQSLERYERYNPGWRAQLKRREREERDFQTARQELLPAGDGKLGATIDRVVHTFWERRGREHRE